MLSPPADDNQNGLQPRAKVRHLPVSSGESWSPPGVQTPPKAAQWRPNRVRISLVFPVALPVSD